MNDRITNDLKDCYFAGMRDFELLNMYRGVPFICKAHLESVPGDTANFKVQPPESVLLNVGKQTILLREELGEPIRGKVVAFDIVTAQLVLGDFLFASTMVGNRSEYRVEPHPTLTIALEASGNKIEGQLIDLSISGAGILIPTPKLGDHFLLSISPGKPVNLHLELPDGHANLSGTVRQSEKKESQLRLAIIFAQFAANKNLVMRYVTRLQMDIRLEVEGLYKDALAKAST